MHSGESVRAIKETILSKISHVNCDDLQEVLPQITRKLDQQKYNLDDFSVIDPEGFYKKQIKLRT